MAGDTAFGIEVQRNISGLFYEINKFLSLNQYKVSMSNGTFSMNKTCRFILFAIVWDVFSILFYFVYENN